MVKADIAQRRKKKALSKLSSIRADSFIKDVLRPWPKLLVAKASTSDSYKGNCLSERRNESELIERVIKVNRVAKVVKEDAVSASAHW